MNTTGVSDLERSSSDDQADLLPRRRLLRLFGGATFGALAGRASLDTPAAARKNRKRGNRSRGGLRTEASPKATETLFRDDFIHGFDVGSADSNWFYFSAGPFVGNDGIETTGPHGLRVTADRFHNTVSHQDEANGLLGGIDHVKWLVYASRFNGPIPGFAAEPGRVLSVEATVSAQTFGTEHHPFGDVAVDDPEDDLRLASAALNGIDFESFMVFDVFFTNKRVYAFYERLPFGRPALGNYAAFSYQIPLLERRPGDEHKVGIAYDRAAGVVRWLVNGKERFRVDQIGRRIDKKFLTLDHGGDEEVVAPTQLDFGMGLFTLLDARLPSGTPLVRLSTADDFYFIPDGNGGVDPAAFADEDSKDESRLFGQGAELCVERFTVTSRRA
jgi:hypothetical protein